MVDVPWCVSLDHFPQCVAHDEATYPESNAEPTARYRLGAPTLEARCDDTRHQDDRMRCLEAEVSGKGVTNREVARFEDGLLGGWS